MVPIRHHELNYFTSTFWLKLIHGADMLPFIKWKNDRYLIQVPNRHNIIISDFTTALCGRICTYVFYYLRIWSKAFGRKIFDGSLCWCLSLLGFGIPETGQSVGTSLFRFTRIWESWDTPERSDVLHTNMEKKLKADTSAYCWRVLARFFGCCWWVRINNPHYTLVALH